MALSLQSLWYTSKAQVGDEYEGLRFETIACEGWSRWLMGRSRHDLKVQILHSLIFQFF
jgi:hypothetical protein